MSKIEKNGKSTSNRPSITGWHVWGIATRLGIDFDDVPRYFDKTRSPWKRDYSQIELLSPNTAKNLVPAGNAANPKTIKKIIAVVNRQMDVRRADDANSLPGWIPYISEEWFGESYPDAKWRPHVPDFVLWEEVVDHISQEAIQGKLPGVYYLYRAHGLDPTAQAEGGVQREIICIHPPRHGHVRVHLVNTDLRIHSGLGYREGQTFSATLYRKSPTTNLRSRFIMVDAPAKGRVQEMKAVMMRMSGTRSTPYASAAMLVRPDGLNNAMEGKIAELLSSARQRRMTEFSFDNEDDDGAFSQLRPKTAIPWEDEEVARFKEFLQQAIFRIDDA